MNPENKVVSEIVIKSTISNNVTSNVFMTRLQCTKLMRMFQLQQYGPSLDISNESPIYSTLLAIEKFHRFVR